MINADLKVLVNSALRQAYGVDAPAVKDSTDLIQVKNIVFSSDDNKALMFGALTDVTWKTYFYQKIKVAAERFIMNDNDAFVAYRRIVKLGVHPDATTDPKWNSSTLNASPYDVEAKSLDLVIEKIYGGKIGTYTFEDQLPVDQMFSAFDGEAQMKGFIGMLRNRMEQDYEQAKASLTQVAINSAIAAVYKDGNSKQQIHLVTAYNAKLGLSGANALTLAAIKADPEKEADYLKFACYEISKRYDDMVDPTAAPRVDWNATATENLKYLAINDSSDLVVECVKDFMERIKSNALTEYFHNEFIKLPKHSTVPYWDALGDDDASRYKIQIKHNDIDQGNDVVIENLAMVFRSDKLVTAIMDKPKQWSLLNPRTDALNYGLKAGKQMYADLSENCVLIFED